MLPGGLSCILGWRSPLLRPWSKLSYWKPAEFHSYYHAHPELARLRRLRNKAGGLRVLGLNDLELRPEDFGCPGIREILFGDTEAIDRILRPEFADAFLNSRSRFVRRIINYLFWNDATWQRNNRRRS